MWSQLLPGVPPDGWRRKPGTQARVDGTHPLARGLTSCWLFNETGGSVAYELARNNTLGVGVGITFNRAAGGFGGWCVSWQGGGVVPATQAGFLNAQLTVLVWVNLAQTQVSKCFVDTYANTTGWALGISDGSNNVVKWFTSTQGGSTDTLYSSTVLTNGLWYQCVGTYDGATKRLFLNGLEEANTSWAGPIGYSGTETAFGGLGHNLLAQGYLGLMDHCLIWDRALSAAEVRQLYRQPFVFLKPPGPTVLSTPVPGGGGGGGGGGGHLLGLLGVGA
jgi:hypothetical protein